MTIEETAFENAQRAYQRALFNGLPNPDAEADKVYQNQIKQHYATNQNHNQKRGRGRKIQTSH